MNYGLCVVVLIMVIKKFVLNKDGYATVEHFDGDIRVIPPLYLGQMIWKGRDGKFRYDKEVPDNYWIKHDFLKSKGWNPAYHYKIDWHKGDYDDRGGCSMERALEHEGY